MSAPRLNSVVKSRQRRQGVPGGRVNIETTSGRASGKTVGGRSRGGGLPRADTGQPNKREYSVFRKLYDRGDFPIALDHDSKGNRIVWKTEMERLDYHHYLPLFFDGLKETDHPYDFFACQGVKDMLEHGGAKILPVIPQLIIPIKEALNTRNHDVFCRTLRSLQWLVTSTDLAGEALVPYYRHILPMLSIYNSINFNSGDGIEYGQRRQENLGDLIEATLNLMEKYGGEGACHYIKYMVPTYQSYRITDV